MKVCDKDMVEYYMDIKKQAELELDKNEFELKKIENQKSNDLLFLEKCDSVEDAIVAEINNIIENKDIVAAEKVIRAHVKQVTLFSIERYYKFFDIELFSGIHKYALYNSRKFINGYYIVPFAQVTYDPKSQIFSTKAPIYSRKKLIECFSEWTEADWSSKLNLKSYEFLSYIEVPLS